MRMFLYYRFNFLYCCDFVDFNPIKSISVCHTHYSKIFIWIINLTHKNYEVGIIITIIIPIFTEEETETYKG